MAARDFGPRAPPVSREDGRIDSADRLLSPQVEISRYSADWEITSIFADFLAERDGFEPEISLAVLPD